MMLSRTKIYKQNRQAVWIIVENKNIQSLMTKQFIQSFSNSLLLLRNNNIFTQYQFMFVCIRNYYESILDLLEYDIITVIQQYRSDISFVNVVLRTEIYRHRNYAFRVCIRRKQKYTVENKNIREQTIKQLNVTKKQ